jgi:hypothetical protein
LHESDDFARACGLSQTDVSVSHESQPVAVSFDDAMDQVCTSCIFCQYDSTFFNLFILPWSYGYLIFEVYDEWVHAVSFGRDGYGLAFRNQSADFRHH